LTRSNIVRDLLDQTRFKVILNNEVIGYVKSSDSDVSLEPIANRFGISVRELRAHIYLSEVCFPFTAF